MKLLKLVALAASVSLTGCASIMGFGYTKVYEGPELSNDEISIIEKHPKNGFGMGRGVSIKSVDGQEIGTFSKTMLELLPGKHTLGGWCDADRKGTMSGLHVDFETKIVNLEAGYHYKVGGDLRSLPRHKWKYEKVELPFGGFGQHPKTKVIKMECNLKIQRVGRVEKKSV